MALTKRVEVDRIEIVGEFKHMQIRTATVVMEDGVELSRSFHRGVISPDTDITDVSSELQNISAIVHTPVVKQKWVEKRTKDLEKSQKAKVA